MALVAATVRETAQVLSALKDVAEACVRIQEDPGLQLPAVEVTRKRVRDELAEEKIIAHLPIEARPPRGKCSMEKMESACQRLALTVQENRRFFDADGADIPEKLRKVMAEYKSAPLHDEDVLIESYVDNFVLLFNVQLIKDDEFLHQMWTNATDEVTDLMSGVQQDSEKLACHKILAERLQIEDRRSNKVERMWALYKDRQAAVLKEDKVQPAIAAKWAEFVQLNAGELSERAKREEHFITVAKQQRASAQMMKEVMAKKATEYDSLTRQREAECLRMRQELQKAVDEIKRNVSIVERLTEDIRKRGNDQQEAEQNATCLGHVLKEEAAAQEERAKLNLASAKQMKCAQALLKEFDGWLHETYTWMKRSLQQKREMMEQGVINDGVKYQQLLQELLNDHRRRLKENRVTQALTEEKLHSAHAEALRLQRVRNAEGKAMQQMKIIEDLEQELAAIRDDNNLFQKRSEDIMAKIKEQQGDDYRLARYPNAALSKAKAWARNFLYNPEEDRWGWLRTKRPASDLLPQSKRIRALEDH